MPLRDAYEESVHAHIESLYDSVEHHEAHLQSTESVSLDSHLEALRQLKEKHRHFDGLLKDMAETGEHGLEHLRDGIDATVDEIRHALDAARAILHREH